MGVEALAFSLGFVHPHEFRSPGTEEVAGALGEGVLGEDGLGEGCATSSVLSAASDCLGDRGELEDEARAEEMMAGEEGEGLKDLGFGGGAGDAVLVVSLFSGEALGDGAFSGSSGSFLTCSSFSS